MARDRMARDSKARENQTNDSRLHKCYTRTAERLVCGSIGLFLGAFREPPRNTHARVAAQNHGIE